MYGFITLPLLVFVLHLLLAFVPDSTCWDELEGNPFKSYEQYPPGKKSRGFSPGQVKGEGGVIPRRTTTLRLL